MVKSKKTCKNRPSLSIESFVRSNSSGDASVVGSMRFSRETHANGISAMYRDANEYRGVLDEKALASPAAEINRLTDKEQVELLEADGIDLNLAKSRAEKKVAEFYSDSDSDKSQQLCKSGFPLTPTTLFYLRLASQLAVTPILYTDSAAQVEQAQEYLDTSDESSSASISKQEPLKAFS